MMSYTPIYITGNQTGLVQEREEFLLPNDAYPILENAYVWRERIKRKQGCETLGRLRRAGISVVGLSLTLNAGQSVNLITALSLGASAQIQPGSINISGVTDGTTYTDPLGDGVLLATGGTGVGGSINYITGLLTIAAGGGENITGTFAYFPGLPVMGLRTRELSTINFEQTIAWDTVYAYSFPGTQWQEFLPGTTWTGTDSNFFWTTNYWVDANNNKIFWATNFSGPSGDPIRYTNGDPTTNWVPFAPQIDNAAPPNFLTQCLAMLPFRGRMVTFNTWEGPNLANSIQYRNRIRWAAIGNPFTVTDPINIPPIVVVTGGPPGNQQNAWRDDIRGKGGFLDIPTAENIVSVGFVRDNLVIYCERSTWQLRYTGRSIAPFQIEKVNTELGAQSTFSAVQFDTSLVGIGDKGIVECDSFKSALIDVKIPDLVIIGFNNNQTNRVYGIRNFIKRLAYWTYPDQTANGTYPNRRLVYNYENDSWAIFIDSFTCFGTFQPPTGRQWQTTDIPWNECNFAWIDRQALIPEIVGGNQQGYVVYLDQKTVNDPTLTITAITGMNTTPTLITSPNHNLQTGNIITIANIPTGTDFDNLNGIIFGIVVPNANQFTLYKFSTSTQKFSNDQLDSSAKVYIGFGNIIVLDNFSIVSKKFSYLNEGQNIQIGYLDILLDSTKQGAISLNVYLNYDDNSASNTLPDNAYSDTFFNTIIPTSPSTLQMTDSSKTWQRVYCATRANFLTLEYTLSPAQMNGVEQTSDVQIDAQILYVRPAGRLSFG